MANREILLFCQKCRWIWYWSLIDPHLKAATSVEMARKMIPWLRDLVSCLAMTEGARSTQPTNNHFDHSLSLSRLKCSTLMKKSSQPKVHFLELPVLEMGNLYHETLDSPASRIAPSSSLCLWRHQTARPRVRMDESTKGQSSLYWITKAPTLWHSSGPIALRTYQCNR